MKTKFTFAVAGDPDVREAVLKTVGAVIGHEFKHLHAGQGEVAAEDFWFMKGILERLEAARLISRIAWSQDSLEEVV